MRRSHEKRLGRLRQHHDDAVYEYPDEGTIVRRLVELMADDVRRTMKHLGVDPDMWPALHDVQPPSAERPWTVAAGDDPLHWLNRTADLFMDGSLPAFESSFGELLGWAFAQQRLEDRRRRSPPAVYGTSEETS